MNPATPGPSAARPAGAPAYYLGRPASVWIAVAPRRRRAAVPAEGPLRWVLTLDGRRLAGPHLPASGGAGETP